MKNKEKYAKTLDDVLKDFHENHPLPHMVTLSRYKEYLEGLGVINSLITSAHLKASMLKLYPQLILKPMRPNSLMTFYDNSGESSVLLV